MLCLALPFWYTSIFAPGGGTPRAFGRSVERVNMESFLFGIVLGVVLPSLFYLSIRRGRARGKGLTPPAREVHTFVTGLKAVGDLSVFRARTKEIITASDHWFGEFGKKYMSWLLSTKQMTMIFEFDVDFRYNLLSPELEVTSDASGAYYITLPPCHHEVRIIDMRVHSEGKTEFLPWLMPDLVGRFLTGGFSVEAKNQLIAEAKEEAARLASGLVAAAQADAQNSARKTLEVVSRGFGVDQIAVHFLPSGEFRPKVDASVIERIAESSSGAE